VASGKDLSGYSHSIRAELWKNNSGSFGCDSGDSANFFRNKTNFEWGFKKKKWPKKSKFRFFLKKIKNSRIFKFQISFKILKELVISAYDEFLKDLEGNLEFQHLKNYWTWKKNNKNLCFFVKLFFQYYLFSFLLRKNRAESPEPSPVEPALKSCLDWEMALPALYL